MCVYYLFFFGFLARINLFSFVPRRIMMVFGVAFYVVIFVFISFHFHGCVHAYHCACRISWKSSLVFIYGDKWDFISSLYHSLGSVYNLQSSFERPVLLSSVTNNTNCPNFIIRYVVYVAFIVKHLKSH